MTLVLENVSKKTGAETWISDVSMSLDRGSLNVLLGPTLAGKTSLMRLMAGLDAPSSGRVLVDGKDVTGGPVQRRSVAMVYQQFINYPSLTVFENIASPLRVARLPRRRSKRGSARRRGCCKLDALSRPQTARTLRRPAAAHRASPGPWSSARTWCCSTSRWPISITSCARNCARSCRGSSPRPAPSSSTRRPSRRRRCCSAATPRRSRKAA